MKLNRVKYEGWNIISYDIKTAKELFEIVNKRDYSCSKILKDDRRSFVGVFYYMGKKLVLKRPKEKDRRKWIRFLTLFRKSEVEQSILDMRFILEHGIITSIPIAAFEKRKFGMVVESFLIYEFLEGNEIKDHEKYKVIKKLNEIHKLGYVHGDSQIRNFLSVNGDIGVIDCKMRKKRMGSLSEMYEMWYLRKSDNYLKELMNEYDKRKSYKVVSYIQSVKYILKRIRNAFFKRKRAK